MTRPFILLLLIVLLWNCQDHPKHKIRYWEEPVTGMRFVQIPAGSFLPGSDKAQNQTTTKVDITQPFWIGEMEVTQEQWEKLMGKEELHPEKPSPFRGKNPEFPVVSVSYHDVQRFIAKMNQLSENYKFRLPTEAEWEYACRAGTTTPFAFGDYLTDSLANYNPTIGSKYTKPGKYIGRPTIVGSYPSNAWGLFDMHGNVWEWVSNPFTPTSPAAADTAQASGNTSKVIRGGSWFYGARNARSSARRPHYPEDWGFSIGFRMVREKME